MQIKFTVWGEPKGKGRPRFTRNGHTYTPADTASYENLVKLEYKQQCGDDRFDGDAMLDMHIYTYFTIPKSVSKKKRQQMIDGKIRPTKKPDMDNIIKIIADSLNKIAYHDDSQIVDCDVHKFYSEEPKVIVVIQDYAAGDIER